MAQIEKIVEGKLRQIELDLVQFFERIAKVDEHQVALVPELRIEC